MDVRGGPSDAEVVARVLGGDQEAFGLVIRRYEAGLVRFATRMLGSRDGAADAVAESFVRAYRHLASCREPSRLRTWLYRIVANRCKSHLARRPVADLSLDDAPPVADPVESIERKVVSAFGALIFCVLIWWFVETRSAPPPPPASQMVPER